MDEPGVYVVRIYRKERVVMAGVVESVSSGERLPFQSVEQLWHALRDLPSPRPGVDSLNPNEEDRR